MTIRSLWVFSLAIIIGVGLGLISFNVPWLNMESSLIPIYIYLLLSVLVFIFDRTSTTGKKVINSIIFFIFAAVFHWLPNATVLVLYMLEK